MQRRQDDRAGVTRVNLLRGFDLCRDGQRVELPPGAQRLVAFVALKGRVLQRGYVSGTLWMDYNQDAANANLRTALWRLRQLSYPLIRTSPTQLSLSADVIVDVREAIAVAGRVAASGSDCREDDLNVITPAGDLLPDWYDEWLVIERERFRQARLHALEALCAALSQKGDYAKAIEVGLGAVESEPLRESAHRAIMRVHVAEGNFSEALRQYALCRDSLSQAGLRLSEAIETLREECTRGLSGERAAAEPRLGLVV